MKSILAFAIIVFSVGSLFLASFTFEDAFAGKGDKRIVIKGESPSGSVRLQVCEVTNQNNENTVLLAKGNGVVRGAVPVDSLGQVATEISMNCLGDGKGWSGIQGPFPIESKGNTNLIVQFP